MSSNSSTLSVSPVATYEGASAEQAITVARAHHGDDYRLGEPYTVRRGGVAGFFAQQQWAVDVHLAAAAPASIPDQDFESAVVSSEEAEALLYDADAPEPDRDATATAPGPFAQALAAAAKDTTVTLAARRVSPDAAAVATTVVDDQSTVVGATTLWPAAPAVPSGDPFETVPVSPFIQVAPILDVPVFPVPALPAGLQVALGGVDAALLDDRFAQDVAECGAAAAVSALFAEHHRHPGMPVLDGGDVVVVAGIGVGVLASARSVAEFVGASASSVHAAGSSAVIAEVHHSRRVKTVADAAALAKREQRAPVVVAVDLGWSGATDALGEVLAALNPVVTWVVVDATRRTADVSAWLDRAGVVADGLVVENVEHTSAVTDSLTLPAPIIFLDGRPATPKQWTGLILAGAC